MQPAIAFWSGGKDSGLALDRVRRSGAYEVVSLITTVNAEFRRVSMHGVREGLIDLQSEAIGIPAHKMYVGGHGNNDDYVLAFRSALESFKARGITNDAHLKQSDVGRALDANFFRELPADVDPCGENGEYHSFIYDGPIFRRPVAFEVGETIYRPLLPASTDESLGARAASAKPVIPIPAAPGPTATKGFWFVDLRAV
jgi:diphthamide synthase (EF-2-diphthine--ammonia ligase)